VARRLQWADAAAIGPGLGRNSATDEFVRAIVAASPVPTVLDADGLTAFAGRTSALRTAAAPLIVTPHTGELARLVGGSADDIEAHRLLRAAEAARKLKAIIVLKGAPTVTASPGAQPVVNSTGNPGMATIGSGDVLTGVIAGLLAQGMQPQAAAWAGVFLHGRAGDIAAGILGERSLLASDILERLPAAFHTLRGR
jgi:NAD(P)H-hydrate epimerase